MKCVYKYVTTSTPGKKKSFVFKVINKKVTDRQRQKANSYLLLLTGKLFLTADVFFSEYSS